VNSPLRNKFLKGKSAPVQPIVNDGITKDYSASPSPGLDAPIIISFGRPIQRGCPLT
jgi:hypothetical protein